MKGELRDGSSKLGIIDSPLQTGLSCYLFVPPLIGEPATHFRVQMMAHGSEASYKRSHLQYSDSPQPDERLSERLTLFGGQVSIPVRNKTYHSVKASFVLIAEHTDRPLVVCFS